MTVPELLEAPPAGRPGLSVQRSAKVGPLTASAAAVAVLMVVGAALRLAVSGQSLFADELSTYWIVATHGLGGVMSLLYGTYPGIPHAEITPPLFFVTSWLTGQAGHSPQLVRLPSLLAGVATIPVVYLVGLRTVGRAPALLAAAFTTLSPFMIYYSAEARSYAVMMLLATLSTLAMLRALETRRTGSWVAYAVCSCAAFYTHYTCAFLLVGQVAWLVWAHPEARRPAFIANLGAVAGVLPWTHGLINDFNSPTTQILSALSPFTAHDVRLSIEHWAIGFPYVEAGGLKELPGTAALLLLGIAVAAVLSGVAYRVARLGAESWRSRLGRNAGLIYVLALSVPVGEAVLSTFSTHVFGVRNLAASWPPLALACAAVIFVAGPRLRFAAAALAISAFALGAAKMLTVRFARTDFQAASDFIAHNARSGDVVIDGTGFLSPGPLTGLDIPLHTDILVFRAGAPAERDHPFGIFDAVTPVPTVIARALAAAHGGRIIVVAYPPAPGQRSAIGPIPSSYKMLETRSYPDFVPLNLYVWGKRD